MTKKIFIIAYCIIPNSCKCQNILSYNGQLLTYSCRSNRWGWGVGVWRQWLGRDAGDGGGGGEGTGGGGVPVTFRN